MTLASETQTATPQLGVCGLQNDLKQFGFAKNAFLFTFYCLQAKFCNKYDLSTRVRA